MTDIDLNSLSIEQLEALKQSIDGAIEKKQNQELMAVRDQLDALIDNSPFTLEEVLAAQKMRKPVAPKYRNPNDDTETWTGRGRKPTWMVEHLASGGTFEQVII